MIYTEVFLPSHAPREYADRETLWNAVKKAEKGKKAQLAYSFDISFQNEFTQEENIALARQCTGCDDQLQLYRHTSTNLLYDVMNGKAA